MANIILVDKTTSCQKFVIGFKVARGTICGFEKEAANGQTNQSSTPTDINDYFDRQSSMRCEACLLAGKGKLYVPRSS
jgi:hypothetical protein